MNVKISDVAHIAARTLSEDDRRRVFALMDHLGNWKNDASLQALAHRLGPDDNIYVLRTSTDIRIVFRLQPDEIYVLDIVRHTPSAR